MGSAAGLRHRARSGFAADLWQKDRGPFVQALRKGLGGFLPKHDIEKEGFFLPFFVAIAIGAIDDDPSA